MVAKQRSSFASSYGSSFGSSFDVYENNKSTSKSTLPYGNSAIKSSQRGPPHIGGSKVDRINKIGRDRSVLFTLVQILIAAFMCYHVLSLHNDLTKKQLVIRDIRRDFDDAEDNLEQNYAKIQRAHDSIDSLQSAFEKLLSEDQRIHIADGSKLNINEVHQKIVDKQSLMVSRVNDLQNTIARLHREEAIEQYGNGPHKVQFNMRVEDSIVSFIVELAGLDMMPHSVHYFLQMVSAKVWDNAVLHHGAKHILFADLNDADGNDKFDILEERNVPKQLSFPEYSDKYPHHKYTLGFSGRPGGPGFYVNTDNNAETHGPGGQLSHDLYEEADPCFGTVVEGKDVIDWMQLNEEFEYTVIDSIRIIDQEADTLPTHMS